MKKILFLLMLLVGTGALSSKATGQTMGDYTHYPIYSALSVTPNVLILMSNDHTNFYKGYNDLSDPFTYNNSVDYYGYFDPNKTYTYSGSNYFEPDSITTDHYHTAGANKWSGNFLNWLTMSHADFVRKALTGGRRCIDATAQTILERADIPSDGHQWTKTYAGADLNQLTPYSDDTYLFYNEGTTLTVIDPGGPTTIATFNVHVLVCDTGVCLESNCTDYTTGYKPEGLLQTYMDRIRFGLMTYSHTKPDQGGIIRRNVGDISAEINPPGSENSAISGMIRYTNNFTQKGWDPTGEMFYEAVRYFKNLGSTSEYCVEATGDDNYPVYGNCQGSPNRQWEDPIQNWCQKNFIIIMNDEYPSRDSDSLPGSHWGSVTNPDPDINVKSLTKAVGDMEGITGTSKDVGCVDATCDDCTSKTISNLGEVRGICPAEWDAQGSFYIAGLANYAFTNDIRSDFQSTQNIHTYAIAFRASPGGYDVPPWPMNQLWLATKYGGFDDKNGNNQPDLQEEWDADNDGNPDNFFYAEKGSDLENAFAGVFVDILKRAASGSSVSVLATSGEGEGTMVQAYYKPAVTSGADEIKWVGYLQSLWIDDRGYMREDSSPKNRTLDLGSDMVVRYFVDANGDTKIKRYSVTPDDPYPDFEIDVPVTCDVDALSPIWEAGDVLSITSADDRNIFTLIDKDKDQVVDEPAGDNDPFDDDGEVVRFHTGGASNIKPYLGVKDDTAWSYLGTTHDDRVSNLIEYIRGHDTGLLETTDVRSRTIDGDVWKLGDIVDSSPAALARPVDNYGVIYGDESYLPYYNTYKDRETVVYVGANDGMLHAFTSWKYNSSTKELEKPAGAGASEVIGAELWAYIPQALVPHLKWLPDPDYTHVYYVDLKPKLVDAKIFTADATHPNGWGTVLIGGLRLGGKDIYVTDEFDDGTGTLIPETRNFSPCYFAIDVTEPREPKLLWERTYSGLGFSASYPAVLKVKNKWFAVFGSGPTVYNGTSTNTGRIFVVDLSTGEPYQDAASNDWLFVTSDEAFMSGPVTLDKNLNYNVDAIYIGETYDDQPGPHYNWKGAMYKVTIPWTGTGQYGSTTDDYVDNPTDGSNPWTRSKLFDSPRPITAPAVLSVDKSDNTWVYFGTGRYWNDDDKSSTDTEYFFGIKDPFFNSAQATYYHSYTSTLNFINTDLFFDADPYTVVQGGAVYKDGSYYKSFPLLIAEAQQEDGWFRPLSTSGERVLKKPAVLGGIVFAPTFLPNADICGFGGNSYVYGFYYETGTAYAEAVFADGTETITIGAEQKVKILDKIDLGIGIASSMGVHIGKEEGATGFIQQSTGVVVDLTLSPAFDVKSGLTSWREK